MPSSFSTPDYAAVIKDLRAKCAEMQRTIAFLEAVSGVAVAPEPPALQVQEPSPTKTVPAPELAGLGQAEACIWLMRKNEGRPMTTREIADGLVAAGYKTNAADPVNNVSACLHHRASRKGDVGRDGKHWRLVTGKPTQGETTATLNGVEHVGTA